MIALAVFYGIKNKDPAVAKAISDACAQAITTSPFVDVTVQQLRDACTQDNLYYLNRSLIFTLLRAAMQVLLCITKKLISGSRWRCGRMVDDLSRSCIQE